MFYTAQGSPPPQIISTTQDEKKMPQLAVVSANPFRNPLLGWFGKNKEMPNLN